MFYFAVGLSALFCLVTEIIGTMVGKDTGKILHIGTIVVSVSLAYLIAVYINAQHMFTV